MKKLLIVCSLSSFVHAGPLIPLLMNPAVMGGIMGLTATTMISSGGNSSRNNDHGSLDSLVTSAQRCAIENRTLSRENGALSAQQRDLTATKQDMKNLEQENRALFAQSVHLQVDNQFKQQTIDRLERDQRAVAAPAPASSLSKPNLLLAAGGTAAAGTAAALWYAHKVSALEQRIRTNLIIRNITRSSPQEMVQSFVDLCNEKLGPVPPARALAHLKQEIAKCIHLLQKYLSWRPWQESIVGSFLALDETKFAQCEAYLESLKAIQDALNKPKGNA